MNGKKVFARNAVSILKLRKCKPTTLLHGVREERLSKKIVKCFVQIVIDERVTYNMIFVCKSIKRISRAADYGRPANSFYVKTICEEHSF
jgi:predicted ribonuclease YlaK